MGTSIRFTKGGFTISKFYFRAKLTRIILCSAFFLALSCRHLAFAEVSYTRIEGANRYETAINISKEVKTESEVAILATGKTYPDALCAAPLAQIFNAPILLTEPDKLDQMVKDELKRREIKKVILIGGQGVISENVKNEINSLGISEIERIQGQDRYDTSVKVAEKLGDKREIVLATGESFSDALSVAPVAGIENMPILLVEKEGIPNTVKSFLKENEIDKVFVIGGQGVVSDTIEQDLMSLGIQKEKVERISGNDRYETNAAIIDRFKDKFDLMSEQTQFKTVFLSTGANFPDSLSGACLAQYQKAPIILVGDNLTSTQQNKIKGMIASSKVYVLGGKGAVSMKGLYLVGLEKEPPPEPKPIPPKPPVEVPKSQKLAPPDITKAVAVINADEGTTVAILADAKANAKSIGYLYGSLSVITVLDKKGEYYYIEALDYGTLNRKKGYVPVSKVKYVQPNKQYSIVTDLSDQKVYVFKDNKLIKEFKCSTGLDQTPTPPGTFLIGDRGAYFDVPGGVRCYNWMRINNDFLFHSVLYYSNGTLIESEYKKLGTKASHGCIRLPIDAIKWMYTTIPKGTEVIIQQ